MEQLFKNMRSRFGARPVPMKDVLKSIIRQKEKVRIIAMVADQTPPEAEIQYFTIFFNQNTPFFVGGDKLSKYMNAPVFFVDMRRVKRGYYEIEFISLGTSTYNEQGAYAITERYARKLEERIKSAPQDWLWSHKRWKHKTWKWENQK
jgi:KDO2-lipid IV(A) lauroyltransferase